MLPIVTDVYNQIFAKAAIYEMIAERTHNLPKEEATKIVQGELEVYLSRLNAYLTDPKNSAATITAVQGANIFLDVMEMGLSFSRIANHVYVSRMKGTGTSVGYKVTKEGAIYLAQRAGAIRHCSEPVIVWKGDTFSIEHTADGFAYAKHTEIFDNRPPFSLDNMLVGYVYVIYPTGERELSRISAQRLSELRAKSQSPDMYNDESFIETKIIKHALRSVRKEPFTGQSQIPEDDTEDTQPVTQAQTSGNTLPLQPTQPVTHPLQDPSIKGYQVPPQYQAPQSNPSVNTLQPPAGGNYQQNTLQPAPQQFSGNGAYAEPF